MIDWSSHTASSPPRKYSTTNPASILWKSQYNEQHGNIWNSCASLQPSTSIWGPDIKSTNVYKSSHPLKNTNTQQDFTLITPPQVAPVKFDTFELNSSNHRPHQRRMSSVQSLSGTLHPVSSPLRFEDPYLVSPPPSPEAIGSEVSSPSHTGSSSPYHSPVSGPSSPTSSHEEFVISPNSGPLFFVQFKGDRVDVFTAPGTAIYNVGDAVMVDADRGRDLGTIIAANVSRRDAAALKQRQNQDRQNALHNNGCGNSTNFPNNAHNDSSNGPTVYNPKQILSLASPSEISDLTAKINDEMSAVSLCNRKAAERNLDMTIVDAEYQWDRRKLTFFYTADSRVDFRDLVRELFRIYKTRIWMCATTARS